MSKKLNWGYGIAGVYIFFAFATIAFVIFSRFHKMDLVTKDYYEEELNYQHQIDRNERTRALSQSMEWDYNAVAKMVILKFPADISAKGISGSIMFFRPSDAAQDLVAPIKLSNEGHQIVDASSLPKGLYRLKVFWNTEEEEFYSEDVLVID